MAITTIVPFAAPALLLLAAISAVGAPAMRPRALLARAELAAQASLAVAIAMLPLLFWAGSGTSPFIGTEIAGFGAGLSARTDPLSVALLMLVSFIGLIVVRYSRTYLDGEPGHARFTVWLLATLASVEMLVIAGNLVQLFLAWIATSLALHRLLLFYPDRKGARVAATKKFQVARLGDAALALAALLLARQTGTTDITAILEAARAGQIEATAPALLLALAALLKSAQFPTHGWLVEVMETPTPVSALLHAGIVNAGGFLVIRFADVMVASPAALATLALVGGFTALFAAAVMLTQPGIKVALAWSTVSQMGFMLLQCGLGAFAVATLHIIAHSLYKAHAFLSSGSVVDRARVPALPGFGQPVRPFDALIGLGFSAAAFLTIGRLFGHGLAESPALLGLGLIALIGISLMAMQALAGETRSRMLGRTAGLVLLVSTAWFAGQAGMAAFMAGTVPPLPAPGVAGLLLIALAVMGFAAIAIAQLLSPLWLTRPAMQALRIHLSHGLYANHHWNRLIGAYRA
jgi:NAD(P)H-quinone oxidoreductase subunit 5